MKSFDKQMNRAMQSLEHVNRAKNLIVQLIEHVI